MTVIRFGTYNVLDLFKYDVPAEAGRYRLVCDVIDGMNVDVLAVQEIWGDTRTTAAVHLAKLAADVGMRCEYASGHPAMAYGCANLAVGLLWRHDVVEPLAFRALESPRVWHGLAKLLTNVDGRPIQFASYHAPPFAAGRRADEAGDVVGAMTRPKIAGLLGKDANNVCADRKRGDPTTYYDDDPYQNEAWYPDLVYQTDWCYDGLGVRHHTADRTPAEVFLCGGLRDVAAVLDVPWTPTCGHWPNCPYPLRRVDRVASTDELIDALRGHEVVRSDTALLASDHCPAVVSLESREIPERTTQSVSS
jgi:endonuclease/exonuclease/phosphatase family metal-dependent hydrolase